MDISSIFATLLSSPGPSKPSTTLLRNSIATTFRFSRTGDSMKGITAHCRGSINWKLSRSTARIKCKFGEEAMIFLHPNLKRMMQGTPKTIKDIATFPQSSCPKQKYFSF
jgi:hypothetical protein